LLKSFGQDGRRQRAVVVGASGGIGAAFARVLAAAGWEVTALARRQPDDLPAEVQWIQFDLCDEITIEKAADAAAVGGDVDLVIIASGVLHDGRLQPEKDWRQIDPDNFAKVFAINTTGPALVIKHFAPLLPRKGKSVIAALSARVGSISDNRLGGWYAYRASKAALNQIIRTAAIELGRKRKDAIIMGLHPGTVATDLSEPFQNNSYERFHPKESAVHLLDVIDSIGSDVSGSVFDWQGKEIQP